MAYAAWSTPALPLYGNDHEPAHGIRGVLRAPQVPRLLAASQIGRLPLASAPLALLLFARESLSLAVAGLLVAVYTTAMAVTAPAPRPVATPP